LDAERIFTQEELPAELQQQRTATGADKRGQQFGADLRKADEAIRTAEILIGEAKTSKLRTEEADNDAEQTGAAMGKNVTPDNLASASLGLSNSTEAVADDAPGRYVDGRPGNKFAVEAVDDVWTQVRIDDKKTISETLHAGDHREWPADKSIQVVIGNAGGIRMQWNGQPLKAPRDPGRVLRFRLPDYAKEE
jgi:hypothetical protein